MSSFFQKLAGGLKTGEGEPQILATSSRVLQKDKSPQKIKIREEEKNEAEKPAREEPAPEPEGQLALDVFQTESDIVIKSTIAGVKPEDLDVEITNDMVTIRGKREKEEEIRADDYYYQECYWGSFSRSVVLPQEIDADRAEAVLKNGVLTIRLPKFEKVKNKKLKVKGGE